MRIGGYKIEKFSREQTVIQVQQNVTDITKQIPETAFADGSLPILLVTKLKLFSKN